MTALLIRLLIVFFLVWLILGEVGMSIARQQAAPDYGMGPYGFAACALPCWAGFTPSITPLNNIPALLKAHVPALQSWREYSPGNIYFEMGQTATSTILHSRGHFHSINLAFSSVPLYFLIDRLGVPDCVEVLPGDGLVLMWDVGDFTLTTVLWGEPDLALHNPDITTQNIEINARARCVTGVLPAWRGFVPLWFYERLAAE